MKDLACIGVMSLAVTICSHAIAQEAPVVVNPETGAMVNFTRAYWDANVDIANKRMQCDFFSFDTEAGVFEKGPDRTGEPIFDQSSRHVFNTRYSHAPLPSETTQVNSAVVVLPEGRGLDRTLELPYWSVVDGVYGGPAALSRSEFVEIVAFNASTENAVRVWYSVDSVPAYSVCYDLDGTPLLPTGTTGSGNTQLVDLDEFTFDFPDASESVPEIINLETGEAVQFIRGRWSYNKDVGGREFTCETMEWNSESQSYIRVPDTGVINSYSPYNGGENIPGTVKALIDDFFHDIIDRPVSTVTLPMRFTESYMEITEEGYRMWPGSNSFERCVVQPVSLRVETSPFGPTEILPLVAGDISVDEMSDVDNSMEGTDTIEGSDGETDAEISDAENDSASTDPDVETDSEISGTGNDSTTTDLDSSDETTSQSGGGSFWLPLLIFALALKRSMPAIQQQN